MSLKKNHTYVGIQDNVELMITKERLSRGKTRVITRVLFGLLLMTRYDGLHHEPRNDRYIAGVVLDLGRDGMGYEKAMDFHKLMHDGWMED